MKYKNFIKALLTMALLSNSCTLDAMEHVHRDAPPKDTPEKTPAQTFVQERAAELDATRKTPQEEGSVSTLPKPTRLAPIAPTKSEQQKLEELNKSLQGLPHPLDVREKSAARAAEDDKAKYLPGTGIKVPPLVAPKPLPQGTPLSSIPKSEPLAQPDTQIREAEAATQKQTAALEQQKQSADLKQLGLSDLEVKYIMGMAPKERDDIVKRYKASISTPELKKSEAQASKPVVEPVTTPKSETPIIDRLKAIDTEISKSKIAIEEEINKFGAIQTQLTTADGLAANHGKSIEALRTEGGSEKLLKSTTAQVTFLEKAIKDGEQKKGAGESGAAVEKLGEFYKQLEESKKIIDQLNKMHDAISNGNKEDADKIKNDLTKYFESEKEKAEAEAAKIKKTFFSMTPDTMNAKKEELVQLNTKKENLIKQLVKENDEKAKILSGSIGKKSKEITTQEKKAAKLGQANKKLQSRLRALEQQGKNPKLSGAKKKSLGTKISVLRKKIVSSMENESKERQKLSDLDLEKINLGTAQKELSTTQKYLKGLVSTGNK